MHKLVNEVTVASTVLPLDILLSSENQHNQSGSTAISVLIRDNKIYCVCIHTHNCYYYTPLYIPIYTHTNTVTDA